MCIYVWATLKMSSCKNRTVMHTFNEIACIVMIIISSLGLPVGHYPHIVKPHVNGIETSWVPCPARPCACPLICRTFDLQNYSPSK